MKKSVLGLVAALVVAIAATLATVKGFYLVSFSLFAATLFAAAYANEARNYELLKEVH